MPIKRVKIEDLVSHMSTVFVTKSGSRYMYFPYWVKDLGNNEYEVFRKDRLPQELKDEINERYKDTYE